MPKKTQVHTYQLLNAMCMYTTVTVGREQVNVHFKNGFIHPYVRRGTFSTDDPDIIKAIESDASNNVEWKRIAPLSANKEDVVDNKDDKPLDSNPKDNVIFEQITGIDSGQKARMYLLARFSDLVSNDLRTNELIKSVATEKGISFVDWAI